MENRLNKEWLAGKLNKDTDIRKPQEPMEENVCKKCGISIETFRKTGQMTCFDDSDIRHEFNNQEPMEEKKVLR